jgi:hypothetical protein
MDNIDPDKLEAFFEATEDWNSAMNMSNSMAFISQFGEYNPGGGKFHYCCRCANSCFLF